MTDKQKNTNTPKMENAKPVDPQKDENASPIREQESVAAPENPPVHVETTRPASEPVSDDDESDPRGGFIVYTDENGKQKRVKRSEYKG